MSSLENLLIIQSLEKMKKETNDFLEMPPYVESLEMQKLINKNFNNVKKFLDNAYDNLIKDVRFNNFKKYKFGEKLENLEPNIVFLFNVVFLYCEENEKKCPYFNSIKEHIIEILSNELGALAKEKKFKWDFIKNNKIFSFFSNSEEEKYKSLTKITINKMLNEFNLNSVHLVPEWSWKDNSSAIDEIYKNIKEANSKLGLPTENLGANKSLNIILSVGKMVKKSVRGLMMHHPEYQHSSIYIFPNQNKTDIQKTWIHEYTHFLDIHAGNKFNKEVGIQNLNNSHLCYLSHIALSNVTNNKCPLDKMSLNEATSDTAPLSHITHHIMAETISVCIGGKGANDLHEKMTLSAQKVINDITLNILLTSMPQGEKTWLSLSDDQREKLLNDPQIILLSRFIRAQVSNIPTASYEIKEDGAFDITYMHLKNGVSVLNSKDMATDINMHKIINIIGEVISLQNIENKDKIYSNLNEYFKNAEKGLSYQICSILKKNSLVIEPATIPNSVSLTIKMGSLAAKSASNYESRIKNTNGESTSTFKMEYTERPLEIIARCSENLITPLMNNKEYNEWKINKLQDTDFINPILGKEERTMICETLYSMARYIGIKVPIQDLNGLPCMQFAAFPDKNNTQDYEPAQPGHLFTKDSNREEIINNIANLRNKMLNSISVSNSIKI